MNVSRAYLAVLACLLIGCSCLLAGCGGERLPHVRYGDDACASCRMIVNDDRFAAAADLKSGDMLKFDDVRCLVGYLADHPDQATRRWVRGYESGQWHDVDQVVFVHGPDLQTPMASGLAAVPDAAAADALSRQWGGKTLRFAELPAFFEGVPTTAAESQSPSPTPTSPN